MAMNASITNHFIKVPVQDAVRASGDVVLRLADGDLVNEQPIPIGNQPSNDPDNTIYGFSAGSMINGGIQNTLIGVSAGGEQTTANCTVKVGDQAGHLSNVSENIFIGCESGLNTTTGNQLTAIGTRALANKSGTSIGSLTAVGWEALRDCDAPSNVAVGNQCLQRLTSASGCVGMGALCMRNLTTGVRNTGIGFDGIHNLVTGARNSGLGYECGFSCESGDDNVFLGQLAGSKVVSGSGNVYIGINSGQNHTSSESGNIIIKAAGGALDTNVIRIGQPGTITACTIGGIASVSPGGSPETVIINPATGQLGSTASAMGGDVSSDVGVSVVGQVALFSDTTGKLITTGQIQMNGSGAMTEVVTMEMEHTATTENDHGLEIDIDADGFGDVQGILLEYVTGAITSVQDEEAILINIDQTASLGGRVVALEVIGTSTGSAEIDAVECGVGCHPIRQQTGSFGDADVVLVLASDETTDLSQGGLGLIDLFVDNGDTITIQDANKFSEIEMIFDTLASNPGIDPLFEYSDGDTPTTWASFSPVDGTNQCRSNGIILWELVDIPLWVVGTSGNFEIRITRQRANVSTEPVGQLVQISATTIYTWNSAGDLDIRGLTATTNEASAAAISLQGSASSGLDIDMGSFIDIDTSLANTQALKLQASNVAGGVLLSCGSGGHEITTTGGIDILSTQTANSSILLRATGTNGSVDVTTGTDGFRLMTGDTNGMTWEDTGSAFSVNVKCSNGMAASYPIVWPDAQGGSGQVLVNSGAGQLEWENNIGVIRDFQVSDMLNSTSSDWEQSTLAAIVPDDLFNALNVREYLVAADSGIGMKLFVPAGEGGITVSISWRKDLANSGTVIWQLFAYNIPNGASIASGSWDTSQVISINDPGTDINTVTTTKNFPLGDLGLVAGESCLLQIVRDVSDTFASSALLMGCTISEGTA